MLLFAQDGILLHVDHIDPRSNGGIDDKKNLITSCNICNLGKADVVLEERSLKRIMEIVEMNEDSFNHKLMKLEQRLKEIDEYETKMDTK